MLCYGPLVSELGGAECIVPQPRHCPPAPPPMVKCAILMKSVGGVFISVPGREPVAG